MPRRAAICARTGPRDRQLVLGQSGTLFSNDGATGPVIFTLPNVLSEERARGAQVRLPRRVPASLIIEVHDDPDLPDDHPGWGSMRRMRAGAGSITSAMVGDTIELVLLDGWTGSRYATRWVAKSVIGNWSVM